ncbi:hypothetical protein IQ267_12595 [filamentous cyanobacterium LEGE 07170]|nr:hypothetical protein [filamentous cyanobacterium LEGE 07170]
MKQIKSIRFTGTFNKQDAEDNNPVSLENVEITFHDSGHILLHLPDEVLYKVNSKRGVEQIGYHSGNQYVQPFKGTYEISGETSERYALISKVHRDTSFAPDLILHQVYIKNSEIAQSDTSIYKHKVTYGLLSRKHICQGQSEFPTGGIHFHIEPAGEIRDREILLALSSELTIEKKPEVQEVNFSYCCGVIMMLLSFCKGDYIDSIYEIEYTEDTAFIQEYWKGTIRGESKKIGITPIQLPHQAQFLKDVLSGLTFSTVEKSGLFPAMYWYVESFRSSITATQILLLFVCLESFTAQFSKNEIKNRERLISKTLLNKIREKISLMLSDERETLAQENPDDSKSLDRYDIYCRKLEARVNDNAISSLYEKTERLLGFYQVEYDDLFPEMDFAEIRSKLVHTGQYNDYDKLLKYHMRINSLLIRLILRVLNYEGSYIERDDSGSLVYTSLKPKILEE